MAGKLITVIPKTTFDFTQGMTGISGGTSAFIIGDLINTLDYTNIGLVIRVHDLTVAGTFRVELSADGFMDYGTFSYNGAPIVGTNIIGSSVVPPAVFFAYAPVIGSFAAVTVKGIIGTPMRFTISVDVILRSGDSVDRDAASIPSATPVVGRPTARRTTSSSATSLACPLTRGGPYIVVKPSL